MALVGSLKEERKQNLRQNGNRRIRALVADKYPLVRSGLRSELDKDPDAVLVGEAEDGKAAIEMAKSLEPDVILMGITLPVLNGLEATARITRDLPASRVVIFSRYDDEDYVWTALKKGASGYLLKRAAVRRFNMSREAKFISAAKSPNICSRSFAPVLFPSRKVRWIG